MFDLIEKRNSPKGKPGGTASRSDAPITALYERLSCEDDLDGESNSVTNQKNLLEVYARDNASLNVCQQLLPARTVKVAAAVTVIRIVPTVGEAIVPGVCLQ